VARTVLYVEDNVSNVRLVEHVLARRPEVRLLVAMAGGVGVELAKEHQPDLVLLDMNLPDLSGEVVLQRLRAEPRTRGIPVVIISADATPGQVERLLAAGAADYLTKPFDVAHLLGLVDGLGDPGAHAPAGGPGPAVEGDGPLDRAVLDSLRPLTDDRPGARLADLLAAYVEDAAARLTELREALAGGDAAAAAHLTHSVRGTSASYGAPRLAGLCAELEQAAIGGDLVASSELLVGIDEEFARVRAALQREFPELAG
jgi:CheY-like chemotaxis protein